MYQMYPMYQQYHQPYQQVIYTQPIATVYYVPQQSYQRQTSNSILTGCLYGTVAALLCCCLCDTMDHVYHDF